MKRMCGVAHVRLCVSGAPTSLKCVCTASWTWHCLAPTHRYVALRTRARLVQAWCSWRLASTWWTAGGCWASDWARTSTTRPCAASRRPSPLHSRAVPRLEGCSGLPGVTRTLCDAECDDSLSSLWLLGAEGCRRGGQEWGGQGAQLGLYLGVCADKGSDLGCGISDRVADVPACMRPAHKFMPLRRRLAACMRSVVGLHDRVSSWPALSRQGA